MPIFILRLPGYRGKIVERGGNPAHGVFHQINPNYVPVI